MVDWKIKARADGRICPECQQPVTLETWAMMKKTDPIGKCWNCRYAHWEVPLNYSRGSAWDDNRDREAFTYIRQAGEPPNRIIRRRRR